MGNEKLPDSEEYKSAIRDLKRALKEVGVVITPAIIVGLIAGGTAGVVVLAFMQLGSNAKHWLERYKDK